MADTYTAYIEIGGDLQLADLPELLELIEAISPERISFCSDDVEPDDIEAFADGTRCMELYLPETGKSDLFNITEWCIAKKLTFSVQWQAKWDSDGCIEFSRNGEKLRMAYCLQDGTITFSTYLLESCPDFTARQIIEKYSPPPTPPLTIITEPE